MRFPAAPPVGIGPGRPRRGTPAGRLSVGRSALASVDWTSQSKPTAPLSWAEIDASMALVAGIRRARSRSESRALGTARRLATAARGQRLPDVRRYPPARESLQLSGRRAALQLRPAGQEPIRARLPSSPSSATPASSSNSAQRNWPFSGATWPASPGRSTGSTDRPKSTISSSAITVHTCTATSCSTPLPKTPPSRSTCTSTTSDWPSKSTRRWWPNFSGSCPIHASGRPAESPLQ